MLDNDQRAGNGARDADADADADDAADDAVRRRGVRIGRTAVTGWVLAAVLVVAGFGTAMGATPAAVPQPVPVADTTETTGTATAGLDPLSLLPTARPLSPAAVLPNLPTIASVPDAVTETATATPPVAVASVPGAQLRTAAFTTDAPDARAAVAIRTALAQIGLPYVWGGNGPTNGDAGFDCSGLTTFSYGSAGVPLPRTAHTQYNAGPHVPDGAPLQPGDLVFYGTTARVHHVGMYLGAGRMVNAPTFGKPVQVAFYRYRGDDYLGATRPAAAAGSLTSGILPFVDASQIPVTPRSAPEQIFRAPTAPMPAVLPQPGDPLPPEQVTAAQAVAESDAVAVTTAATRSASVAGATTSTTAPVTTTPAATDPATTGTATTGTATSPVPSSGAPVAGTTTTTVAPAVPAPTVTTAPQAVPDTGTTTSTTTQAPVATKTTTSTPTTTKTTTKEPATTTTTTVAEVVTTSEAAKDDETSTTKTTTKTTEKTTEEAAEEAKEVKTEEEDSGDSEEAAEEAEDSAEDSGEDD
jgi:cell wall-associated NlpC family hydrolase